MNACGDAPEGWSDETPSSYQLCSCGGAEGIVEITLECACCDS